MPTPDELKMLQALPLELKIEKTKARIREWVYYHGKDKVYISFSGGKDSLVLSHIALQEFPELPLVFVNTGLEYPEIVNFVKTFQNVVILRPKKTFVEIVEKYGFPIISKEQSQYIQEYKASKSDKLKDIRLNGNKWGRGHINKRQPPFIDSDIKISDRCCHYLKKEPIKRYEKETEKIPMMATMADESSNRKSTYLKQGCNAYNNVRPVSNPMGFWTEQDVLQYIKLNNLEVCSVYGELVEKDNKLHYTKCQRTGCVFCGMGLHKDKEPNRFQQLKETHPKLWDYVVNNLGLKEVVDFMNKECKCHIKLEKEENKTLF